MRTESTRTRLRVLFIGTDSVFSLLHLEALTAEHEVVAILQSVGRRRGWPGLLNRKLPTAIRGFARRRSIPFAQAERSQLEIVRTLCDRHRVDIACVAGMACLLPADLLDHPPLGFVNAHPATLPEWRGPLPVFWQLVAGCERIGVTLHRLQAGEDDGPILLQATVPVVPWMPYGTLMAVVAEKSSRLLIEALARVRDGTAVATPQPARSPTPRARKVEPADVDLLCRADWPIERCAWLISSLGGILPLPRPRLRDLGRLAEVSGYAREPDSGLPPGRFSQDRRGRFLAHPQGRIDLRLRWQPLAWAKALLACRRAGLGWTELI